MKKNGSPGQPQQLSIWRQLSKENQRTEGLGICGPLVLLIFKQIPDKLETTQI